MAEATIDQEEQSNSLRLASQAALDAVTGMGSTRGI
jgi:hypothetical protein